MSIVVSSNAAPGGVTSEPAVVLQGHTTSIDLTKGINFGGSGVTLRVVGENSAAQSNQFECSVHVFNPGPSRIRLNSLRALNPDGTEIQKVTETSQSDLIIERENICRDLSHLISEFLLDSSENYRMKLASNLKDVLIKSLSFSMMVKLYYYVIIGLTSFIKIEINKGVNAWSIKIKNATEAKRYYLEFLDPVKNEQKILCSLFSSKLEALSHIDSKLGDGLYDDSIADIEPNATFSRAYVFNCKRSVFNTRTFTFTFDAGYSEDELKKADLRHLAASITTSVAPKPVVLNVVAITAALLGSVLKKLLDSISSKTDAIVGGETVDVFGVLLFNANFTMTIGAAMITALFFYNIYESTEFSKRLNVDGGWRSALIIGGVCGLLNQRVVAALQGLLG
jgi:hypothetical protein